MSHPDLPDGPLRLGPLLRFVDETSATVWVETDRDAVVTVRAGDRTVRTLRLQVRGGDHRVKVRRLRKGRHTFALLARDAAGNRSESVSSSIRVRRK